MKQKTLSEKTFTEEGLRVIDWENVKQFIKEILEEIENVDLKMAKEVMETEKTNNFDDFSEFAQGEVTARRIFAMNINQIIKKKAGDDLI